MLDRHHSIGRTGERDMLGIKPAGDVNRSPETLKEMLMRGEGIDGVFSRLFWLCNEIESERRPEVADQVIIGSSAKMKSAP